jgi:glucose-6-phosphate isomerase
VARATAGPQHYRHLPLTAPNVSEPYAALSYFGLAPAALAGADLETLLFRASAMAANTEICHGDLAQTNLAAKLGATLGVMAQHGRNQITFITSLAIAGLGDWAAQLLVGLDGLTPITGQVVGAPDSYGDDRFFIHLRLKHDTMHDTAVQALIDAGQPVITLHLEDPLDVGGQLFLWQMATAVAGHLLQANPFGVDTAVNQPPIAAG